MITKELKKNQNFNLIVQEVIGKSSLQKKKIIKLLDSADKLYFQRAENFSFFFFKY